jgi:hypothetical protein
MSPTIADVLALTDLFQDLLFDARFPRGAERDETGDPVATPDDFLTEARAAANAVAPFLRAVDGQLVAVPGRTIVPTPSGRCPTCDSHAPNLHPAVQSGGEVEVCSDSWHHQALIPVGTRLRPDGTLERTKKAGAPSA